MPMERRGRVTRVNIDGSTGNRRSPSCRRKTAVFSGWHEPCDWRQSSTVQWGTRGAIPRVYSANLWGAQGAIPWAYSAPGRVKTRLWQVGKVSKRGQRVPTGCDPLAAETSQGRPLGASPDGPDARPPSRRGCLVHSSVVRFESEIINFWKRAEWNSVRSSEVPWLLDHRPASASTGDWEFCNAPAWSKAKHHDHLTTTLPRVPNKNHAGPHHPRPLGLRHSDVRVPCVRSRPSACGWVSGSDEVPEDKRVASWTTTGAHVIRLAECRKLLPSAKSGGALNHVDRKPCDKNARRVRITKADI